MSAELSSSLLRAARRKHSDPDAIFATGWEGGLTADQLARLADRLREAHPAWRVPPGERDILIADLLEADWSVTKIADRLGCSRPTVAKRAEAIAAALEATPTHGLIERSICKENGHCGCPPILSFSASSGAHMTLERTRELREALGLD